MGLQVGAERALVSAASVCLSVTTADAEGTTTSALSISSDQNVTRTRAFVADDPHSLLYTLQKALHRRKCGNSVPPHAPTSHIAHPSPTISTNFLASAFNPAKRKVMFSSICISFFTERGSCNCAVVFFSTPSTMHFSHTAATTEYPYPLSNSPPSTLRTASMAYSTWNKWPSGEKTVNARS